MQTSPLRTAITGVILLCLCFVINPLQAEIIFQHNFQNLDNPPTDAQLSTPSIIHPDLTNIFLNSGLLYRTRDDAGQKALSITASGTTATYVLMLQVPTCKTLTINSISFKGFASNNANFSISVLGVAYGVVASSTANSYTNVTRNKKVSAAARFGLPYDVKIEILVSSAQAGTISGIDDLTINGSITNSISELETIIFPNSSASLERCPGASTVGYNANLNTYYQSLNYTIDDMSAAAGVTMTGNAVVTYPPAFIGKTTITATAIGCANETVTKSIDVLTTPSGPPSIDMNFTTTNFPYNSNCSTCGYLKNSRNTCFTAGNIYQSGFEGKTVTARVRFEDGVRNVEITGKPNKGANDRPGFDLYFRQSDFNNYHGTLSLPTGPMDEQGKENLRLMIRTDNPVNGYPVQKIKPTVSWNEAEKFWIVSYRFSNQGLALPWPANTFKVFLSDALSPIVKLESFTGNHTSQGDALNWKTTEEASFSHFEVENSLDTLQGFQYVATVSAGSNPLGGEYNYTHSPSADLKQYYRLKMVYSDNTFTYSKITTVRSDIIYRHNFENLSNPATEAQLNEPTIIGPGFTSSWTGNSVSGTFFSNINWTPNKVLPYKTTNVRPVLTLKLTVPNCKKLRLTDVSLAIFTQGSSSFDGTFRVTVTGLPETTYKLPEGWSTVNINRGAAELTGEVIIQISQPTYYDGRQLYVDDVVIYGTLTDNLVDIRTLSLSSAAQRCQKGEVLDYSPANKSMYQSILYSLDNISLAAGNQINASTGLVTFSPTFSGQSTISASAINCINLPLSTSKNVITNAGGLPTSDIDLQTTFPEMGETPGADYGILKNGCFTTGLVADEGFEGQTVTSKVRFTNNVRNIEITGNPFNDEFTNVRVQLYFSQSDFDNYRGSLQLPKNPSDAQGKANLRLRLFSERFSAYGGRRDITPDLQWDDTQKRWVVLLNFAAGMDSEPGNAPWAFPNFKVFLSDAGGGLPVKLESISAKSTTEGNRITWKTSEEINFSHFEIEKSEDPRQGFQYLATVSSAKNQSGSTYNYTDVSSSALLQYYRLKMVDSDGSFEHSKIVTAEGGQLKGDQLLIYPNPTQSQIFVQSQDAVKSIKLVDQKGDEVLNCSFLDEKKSVTIPLPKLHPGAYYLKVNTGTKTQQVRKVIIR